MEIGTYFQLLSLASSSATTTRSAGAATTFGAQAGSVFGPAYQLSLGQSAQTSSAGVYSIYTRLIAPRRRARSTVPAWQFNLSAVMNAAGSPLEPAARSQEQREAAQAAITQAFNYIDQGNYDQARNLMQQLLGEDKTNAAALHALGYAELSDGQYDKAEQFFLKAHALNPTVGYDNDAANARLLQQDDETVFKRASAMIRTPRRRDEGIRLLIELTKRSPEYAAARVALGDAMLDAGDGTNGLMQYSTVIRTADVGELGPIESRLRAQLEATPGSAFVWHLLGKLQLRQQRYEEALKSLRQAAELAEDKTPHHYDLARAYVGVGRQHLSRGDLVAALSSFDQAKGLNPTGPEVKAALGEGYVRRAEQRANRRDYGAAAADYARAAALLNLTSSKRLRQRAADGAYKLGLKLQERRVASGAEINEEATVFQAAYDLDPSSTTRKRKLAEVCNALGDQHLAAGKIKEAAHAYRRAHELFKYDQTYKANVINAFVAYADERLANLNYTDAVNAYSEAFKIDTGNLTSRMKLAAAYNARGLDYKSDGKMKEAARDFKNCLRLFPDNAEYQANYDSVSAWDN